MMAFTTLKLTSLKLFVCAFTTTRIAGDGTSWRPFKKSSDLAKVVNASIAALRSFQSDDFRPARTPSSSSSASQFGKPNDAKVSRASSRLGKLPSSASSGSVDDAVATAEADAFATLGGRLADEVTLLFDRLLDDDAVPGLCGAVALLFALLPEAPSAFLTPAAREEDLVLVLLPGAVAVRALYARGLSVLSSAKTSRTTTATSSSSIP
mmetsp:Transcript_20401/g.44083  ORF Transcript_20401/g.44083 Transcript_20401/m.44083 type:complete len:209 (+) Transcript_20401:4341-4967(+)